MPKGINLSGEARIAPTSSPADLIERKMEVIEKECQKIAELQQQLKRRAMIYQVDLKEQLAQEHGLSVNAYYHLPYDEWTRIRQTNCSAQEAV